MVFSVLIYRECLLNEIFPILLCIPGLSSSRNIYLLGMFYAVLQHFPWKSQPEFISEYDTFPLEPPGSMEY